MLYAIHIKLLDRNSGQLGGSSSCGHQGARLTTAETVTERESARKSENKRERKRESKCTWRDSVGKANDGKLFLLIFL